jgi:ferritin-like metal-binding protein YciE
MAGAPREKLLRYLTEAHAMEAGLVSTLAAHLAITPRGSYHELLERHLGETAAHRDRLQERVRQLGAGQSPLEAVYGLAQLLAGQALSLGKLPLDLLRGSSAEEKLLKNAKDEAASEALEIATYDAIEALALAVDDPKTATLAREHRAQEEIFLAQLRGLIGELAGGVAAPGVEQASAAAPRRRAAPRAAAPRRRPAARAPARRAAAAAPQAAEGELAIAGYDDLTVAQLLPRLRPLTAEQLARIDGYERGGRNRKRVLDRVAALRSRKLEAELTGRS